MDANRAHRVVDVECQVQKLYHNCHQNPGTHSDNRRADGVHSVTSGSNTHESGKGGVQAHGNIRLSVLHPCITHGGAGGDRRSNGRRQKNGSQFRRGSRSRAVEAVPAQPQNEHAQRTQGNGVSRNRVDFDHVPPLIPDILSNSGAEEDGSHQSRNPAYHVNGAGTGVVMESLPEKPAAAPNPVRLNGVDNQGDDCGVKTVSGEFCPFCHGSGNDGGSGSAEHQVEHKCGRARKASVGGTGDKLPETGKQVQIRHSNQAMESVPAHHQRVAQQGEYHCPDTEVHQVFHDDISGVFGAGEAGFAHGKPRLHPEYQSRAD